MARKNGDAAQLKILTVCTGNICRSPFAASFIQKQAPQFGISLEAESAGSYALPGNRATPEAVTVASEFGVDLKPHRASALSIERLRSVSLVLVMSRAHEEEVLELLGALRDRAAVYLLGQFHPTRPDPPDIADPIGGTLEAYRVCYRKIQESSDGLLGLIQKGQIRI